MPQWLIMLGVGVLFLLLGMGSYFWGRGEENAYFNSMPTRRVDIREYLEHWPFRPEPGALKVGGWIMMAIGLVLSLVSGAMWLWG